VLYTAEVKSKGWEKTEETTQNGQSRDTGNTGHKTQNNEEEKAQLLPKAKQLYHFPRWTI
jgi:hypothetical protein